MRLPIAFPVPHFMAFAPLDAWAKLLWRIGIPSPRYWPRLAFALFTSTLGTLLTLPERILLAPILWQRGRGSSQTIDRPTVVILGYARSGTTHLHYLLSCDRQFVTPRWYQCLAPQGFLLSWTFLRLFLVPFMSNKRLMDDMAFGPEWPSEDEFAVNNWSASAGIPGRLIAPSKYPFFRRFHFLKGLSPRELESWRRHERAFLDKVAMLAPARRLLIKSPSHTARPAELARLLPGAKFIHIARPPEAVVRSNVSMLTRARVYHLEDGPPAETIRETIVEELAETTRVYDEQVSSLPPGTLVEMRYQDLIADPVGKLRAAYAQLGLEWTEDFESRLLRYLDSVSDYKAAHSSPKEKASDGLETEPRLDFTRQRFGHGEPAIAKVPLPETTGRHAVKPRRVALAAVVAFVLACALGGLWVLAAKLTANRWDWFVWPTGVVIGVAALKTARLGSTRLGAWAATLTLVTLLAVAFPVTRYAEYADMTRFNRPVDLRERWPTVKSQLTKGITAFWATMGCLSAYRFASRRQTHPDNV